MGRGLAILTVTLAAVALTSASLPAQDDDRGRDEGREQREVSIDKLRYKPESIEVRVGETVVWVNDDDRDHTVIADDGDSFDSGKISAGDSFSHTFEKAGVYKYHCRYHPRMKGKVVVKE